MRTVLKEFREFAFKGSMLDLAIGLIIGSAFGAVVSALANGVLLNLIGSIFGKPNFDSIIWRVGSGKIEVGDLITALVNFLIIAIVVFLIVKAVNKAVRPPKAPPSPPTRDCPYCLSTIPLAATRCLACTSVLEAPPAPAPVEATSEAVAAAEALPQAP